MIGWFALAGVSVLAIYLVRRSTYSASGKCSHCGTFSRHLIPNEDARKPLLLCKMCNAELEIERSLKISRNRNED